MLCSDALLLFRSLRGQIGAFVLSGVASQSQQQQQQGRQRQNELWEDFFINSGGRTGDSARIEDHQQKILWLLQPTFHHYHRYHRRNFASLPQPHQQATSPSDFSSVKSRQCGGLHYDNGAFLQTLCEKGQLDRALDVLSRMHIPPSAITYMSLLNACIKSKALPHAKRVHAHITQHSTHLTGLLGDFVVLTLAKCGAIEHACQISATLPRRTVFSWTAIISAYAECGRGHEALKMHQCMLEDGLEPNNYTFVSLCKACGSIQDLQLGKKLHADARMKGFASDAYVGNTLVSMYGKCGAILEAEDVFSAMSCHNFVSWTAMLSAYAEWGHAEKVLQLYRQMQEEGVRSERLTFGIALDACGTLAKNDKAHGMKRQSTEVMSLEIGRALHADARRKGYTLDTLVCNALLTMYGKCGTIEEAENVFCAMSDHDVVSWTAMLSAYVQQGQSEKALWLHRQMQKHHVCLNDVTLMSILQACSETGSFNMCKQLHFGIVSAGYDQVPSVATTLINAYGSCASMIDAQAVFDELSDPDVVSWTACIDGHAGEGDAAASLCMYEKLKLAGIKPCNLTFTSVLVACSHVGLIFKGLDLFESMSTWYGMTPDLKQYGIMIDLLGRAGDFKRVEHMLHRMPMKAGLTIWLCLLRACHTHGNLELAKRAFRQAVQLHPKQASTYVLMSNICANAELKECVTQI